MSMLYRMLKLIYPNLSEFFEYLLTNKKGPVGVILMLIVLPLFFIIVFVRPMTAKKAFSKARSEIAENKRKLDRVKQENDLYPLW